MKDVVNSPNFNVRTILTNAAMQHYSFKLLVLEYVIQNSGWVRSGQNHRLPGEFLRNIFGKFHFSEILMQYHTQQNKYIGYILEQLDTSTIA